MSEITFSADLDTKKLDAEIKKSNITIKDWVKGVEDGSIKMDQAIAKTTKNTKEAVKEQQALIKSLEGDIKRMENLITSATPMAKNKGILAELSQMKANLAVEQEKLNGLQNTGIKQDAEEAVSKNKIIESLKKWGLGLLTITGAIKAFKALIASSNVLTEEFGFAVDGAKGALQQFFQVFSTGAGQTGNPIANMIKGFKGSKELAQNIDLYNDSMRANHVLEAQEIETLKQKEAIFRNASNTAKQRERALNDWIAIRKEAAARELKIEQDLNASLLNEIKNRPNLKGITDQEIGGFITMYAKNPQLMQKAGELSKIYSGMAEWDTADKIANLKKEIDALLPSGITFESLMLSIRLNSALSDKQIDALAESYKRLATAQGGGAQVEAESARWLGSIINKGEDAEKKLNDIKLQIDTLTGSLTTANESERKGIADKIILLEKELKLQQDIVNAALMAATIRETPPSKISGLKPSTLLPGGLQIPNTLAGKPTYDSGDYIPGTVMLTDQGKANQKKKSDQTIADMLKADEERIKNQQELIKGASELVYLAGKQLGLSEDDLKILDDKLQVIGQFASGNIVGAAVTAAMSIISGFMSLIPDNAAKFAAQVEHLNRLLEVQQRLIDQSARTGLGAETREEKIARLESIRAVQQAALAKAEKTLSGGDFWNTQAKMKRAEKTWNDMTLAIQDSDYAILQASQDLDDFLIGGITGTTIADVIAQGFAEGKTSVDDFAVYMNDILNNAVLTAFTDSLLSSDKMKSYLVWLKEAMSGGITPEEAKQNAQWVADIAAENKATYESMTSGLKVGSTSQPGLSGIVGQMSEGTGNELTGLFRRFADEQRVVKDYSIMGVNHLVGIEKNTYGSWQELKDANVELKSAVIELKVISGNTKQPYSE